MIAIIIIYYYYYYYYYYSHVFPDSRVQHCNYATLLAGRCMIAHLSISYSLSFLAIVCTGSSRE